MAEGRTYSTGSSSSASSSSIDRSSRASFSSCTYPRSHNEIASLQSSEVARERWVKKKRGGRTSTRLSSSSRSDILVLSFEKVLILD